MELELYRQGRYPEGERSSSYPRLVLTEPCLPRCLFLFKLIRRVRKGLSVTCLRDLLGLAFQDVRRSVRRGRSWPIPSLFLVSGSFSDATRAGTHDIMELRAAMLLSFDPRQVLILAYKEGYIISRRDFQHSLCTTGW